MSAGWIVLIVIIVLIIALLVWGVGQYNALVVLRNRVKNGWAQTDVQLKKRADLVPNLVATVKGYAQHESSVFEEVTKARASVLDSYNASQAAGGESPFASSSAADAPSAEQLQARAAAEAAFGRAIVNVLATAENYPQLQANQNFLDLQAQLKQLEDKIGYARQFYNDVVMKYNTQQEVFPSNIIAGLFHFQQAQSFEVTDQADRQAPKVDFGA